jgi:hypothetical protein
MCYNRIHIYTKYEDFYFEPNPRTITLMHRNAQKDRDGGYSYHVQGSWSNRTPESLVQTIVNHTKYRYTDDGVYRSEKDIQREKPRSVSGTNQSQKSMPFCKVNRQEQIEEFRNTLCQLCESRGLSCRNANQLTYVGNGFEEFIIEFAIKSTIIVNKKCPSLNIKETYNQTYNPCDITPIQIIEFVESHISLRTQEEYVNLFYEKIKERCDHYMIKCQCQGNRVFISSASGTYYVDAICGKDMEIYRVGMRDPLYKCAKNANAQYVVNYIWDYDKDASNKEHNRDFSKIALIAVAVSGWVVAGVLLAMLLLR